MQTQAVLIISGPEEGRPYGRVDQERERIFRPNWKQRRGEARWGVETA